VSLDRRARSRGTLLGLAVGDALGAAVEFDRLDRIRERFGPAGLADLVAWHGFPAGSWTDDTQMSLATARGLVAAPRAGKRDALPHIREAYLDWLRTQDDPHQRRAPGRTCFYALRAGGQGTIAQPINNSKGCGGVMRVAPIGLVLPAAEAFDLAARAAAVTHGHPSGYLSAGYLAAAVSEICAGSSLEDAAAAAERLLVGQTYHEETSAAVQEATRLAADGADPLTAIPALGRGWVGEEALAIAVFCALRFRSDWRRAVLAAVNHDGDSDSTGSICGAILGAALGPDAIPAEWVGAVEEREAIERVAEALIHT